MGFQDFFTELLYLSDFFKTPFNFNFTQNHGKITTGTGQFLSLLIYIIIIIMFFQSNFYLKIDPAVTSQVASLSSRPKLTFNSSNFELAFGIFNTDGNSVEIDPTIMTLSANASFSKVVAGIKEMSSVPFEVRLCQSSDFQLNKGILEISGFTTVYCLNNLNFDLYGFITEGSSASFNLMVEKCVNTSTSSNCKSPQEIAAFLQYKVFGVYYLDHNIDNNNYERPVYLYPREEHLLLDSNSFKRMSIVIKKLAFVSSNNLFYHDGGQTTESFLTDQISVDSSSLLDSSLIATIMFLPSYYVQQNTRIYQKFSDVLASLSATANLFIFIGFIFVRVKNRFDAMKFVVKRVFDIREEAPEESPGSMLGPGSRNEDKKIEIKGFELNFVDKSRSEELAKNSLNDRKSLKGPRLKPEMDFPHPKRLSEKSIDQIRFLNIEPENIKQGKLDTNFIEFLRIKAVSYLKPGRLTKKEQFLLKAEREYENMVQILYLMRKMIEVDNLKDFIFTATQKKLFNLACYSGMEVPSEEALRESLRFENKEERSREIEEVLGSYRDFSNISELTETDLKLFEMLRVRAIGRREDQKALS